MANSIGKDFRNQAVEVRALHGQDRREVAAFVGLHLLAALAPVTFSWSGLWLAAALYVLTGIGVTMGYHRLFAHRSFTTTGPVRWLLALLGGLAVQGGPLRWCAMHRLHHRHADRPHDPQQSAAPFWQAHLGWVANRCPAGGGGWRAHPVVAELRRDAVLRFLEFAHGPLNVLFAVALFAAGWLAQGWALAASLLVWGVGVRVVALWHMTLVMNSIAHRRGYRNYPTRDNSRNVWWLALLSFGECWHNNHHARPAAARLGHRWFEVDPVYPLIALLGWLGLATRIIHPRARPAAQDRSLAS